MGFHPLRSLRLLLELQDSSSSNSAEFKPTWYADDDKTFSVEEFNVKAEALHRLDFIDEEDKEQFLDSASFSTTPSYLSVGSREVRRSRRPALNADTD